MANWGYTSVNGPESWSQSYPLANGPRQSPIDIRDSVEDIGLSEHPLCWRYDPKESRNLSNSGHSWKLEIEGTGSCLTGGPLQPDTFRLEQIHCHWGQAGTGSEHTIQGEPFSAELHLVHWNTRYCSFAEAVTQPDGLAVLGVLLKEGEENSELQKIIDVLRHIPNKGDRITMTQLVDPACLLPETHSYWTYEGSLTTPPCNESVIWIVFKQPVDIAPEQLAAFRRLKCYHSNDECPKDEFDGCIVQNYRPPCPINNRVIKSVNVQ